MHAPKSTNSPFGSRARFHGEEKDTVCGQLRLCLVSERVVLPHRAYAPVCAGAHKSIPPSLTCSDVATGLKGLGCSRAHAPRSTAKSPRFPTLKKREISAEGKL